MFGSSISTRQAVSDIEKNVDGTPAILDFSQIDFVSRSFAHEFLRFLKRINVSIEMSGLSPDVEKWINFVKEGRASTEDECERDEITESSYSLFDPSINF